MIFVNYFIAYSLPNERLNVFFFVSFLFQFYKHIFPVERRISLFLCKIFLPNERLVALDLCFVPSFFSLSPNFF